MGYIPPLAKASYGDMRKAFEGANVKTVPRVKQLGAESMTKTCYSHESYPAWVCLVGQTERVIRAEVETLVALAGKGLNTPYLGEGKADDLVFKCKQGAIDAYAFLEMRFAPDYRETKVKDDENATWFCEKVLPFIRTEGELEELRGFINALLVYLAEGEDIPDLQVIWDETGARQMFVFDPGDPLSWGTQLEKHKRVLNGWAKWTSAKDWKRLRRVQLASMRGDPKAESSVDEGETAAAPDKGFVCAKCGEVCTTGKQLSLHKLRSGHRG